MLETSQQRPLVTEKKRLNFSAMGSWLLVWVSLFICGMGCWMVIYTIWHAPVAQLHVSGDLTELEKQVIYEKVQPTLKDGYFTTDLSEIRDTTLQVSWIDHVNISRHWPHGIMVRAYPAHAVARWGSGRLLSDNGRVFFPLQQVNRPDLPIIHGSEVYSKELMVQFKEINQWFEPIGMQLQEFYMTDRQTSVLIFKNGIRVVVDKDRRQEKLKNLRALLKKDLNENIPMIENIDLRYKSGLAIRYKTPQPIIPTATPIL